MTTNCEAEMSAHNNRPHPFEKDNGTLAVTAAGRCRLALIQGDEAQRRLVYDRGRANR